MDNSIGVESDPNTLFVFLQTRLDIIVRLAQYRTCIARCLAIFAFGLFRLSSGNLEIAIGIILACTGTGGISLGQSKKLIFESGRGPWLRFTLVRAAFRWSNSPCCDGGFSLLPLGDTRRMICGPAAAFLGRGFGGFGRSAESRRIGRIGSRGRRTSPGRRVKGCGVGLGSV